MIVSSRLGSRTDCSGDLRANKKDIPLPASQNPSNADLPISGAVWAGDTLYVSGWLDPDMKTRTGITSQTVGLLQDIQKFLASQKLTLGDVVMRVPWERSCE